jgi:hypothetical protein
LIFSGLSGAVEGFQAGENQRAQSAGSYATKPCKISSFITENKDFYDKILQNTCVGQNLLQFALLNSVKITRIPSCNKTMNDTRPMT